MVLADHPGLEPLPGALLPARRGGLTGTSGEARRTSDGAALRLVVLTADADPRRTAAALAREAAAVAALPPSPSLVPVLAAGVRADRSPWYAEPRSTAAPLVLPLPTPQALSLVDAMADGLAVLHAGQQLHGPLHDDDVREHDGVPALAGALLPALEALGGDPPAHLLPPEVHAGGLWSPAADVWALAALAWRLLHGRPHAETLLGAVQGSLPAPRQDLPAQLRAGLLAGLSPDPAARPSTPAALRALLQPDDRRDTLSPRGGPPSDPAPAGSPAPGLPAPTGRPLGSGYLLHERIGRGATGQVFRGERRRDSLPVAVKLLRPELAEDPETVVRFLRERTVLVGIAHPSLVRVLDLVAEEGVLAVVMDLVDGPDLRRLLAEEPPNAAQALLLLGQVAGALAVVHAAGVVHRDLKPENVLLQTTDGGRTARLTDFGLARAVGAPALTRLSAVVGTPEYLAPEVASGREPSPASDVYSLGVVAYELLCGRRPFDAPHPAAVLRAHLQDPPVRPDGLSDPMWDLLDRCLAKDPAQRPEAAGLALELLELGAQLPPGAAAAVPTRPTHPGSAHPGSSLPGSSLPTASATVVAPEAPPPAPASVASQLRRRLLVAAAVSCAALAAVGGWYAAAPDRPQPPAGPSQRQDLLPLQVFADPAPAGTVRLRFDGSQVDRLEGFVVLQDGQPTADGLPPDTTEHLAIPGDTDEHCYTVLALVTVPVDTPRPSAAPPRTCVRALP